MAQGFWGRLQCSHGDPAGCAVLCVCLIPALDPQAAHGPADAAGEAAAEFTPAEERGGRPGHPLHAGE